MARQARDVPRGTPQMAVLAGSAACSPVFTDAVRWFNSPLAHPHSPRNTGHSALPADRLCPAMSHRPLRRPGFTVGSSDPPCPYTLPSRALAGVSARSPSQPGHRRDGWRRPSFPCRQTLIPLVSAHETLAHAENRKHGRRIGMRQFGYCLGERDARRGAVARAAECESSLRPVWATPINARRDDHGVSVLGRGAFAGPSPIADYGTHGSDRGAVGVQVFCAAVPAQVKLQ